MLPVGSTQFGQTLCVPRRLCTDSRDFDSSWRLEAVETVLLAFLVHGVLGTKESGKIILDSKEAACWGQRLGSQ